MSTTSQSNWSQFYFMLSGGQPRGGFLDLRYKNGYHNNELLQQDTDTLELSAILKG